MQTTMLLCAVAVLPLVWSDRQSAINKAIEQTKTRQNRPLKEKSATGDTQRQQQRILSRTESIDVFALNALIKSFDRTWTSPKLGSKEPVGSNFQYKKTCASIYKARHGACSQLGFGSMCFNYCFEKGEKVQYHCVDASDAAYCKSSSNFDAYLAKYRKDAYKAKAYVHQMISRCFATAICNMSNGILNSTMVVETVEASTPRPSPHLRLTRPAGAKGSKKTTTTTTTTTTTEEPRTTLPKKIPIWQKLLKGKPTPTGETTFQPERTTEQPIDSEEKEEIETTTIEELPEETDEPTTEASTIPTTHRPRATWKPLNTTSTTTSTSTATTIPDEPLIRRSHKNSKLDGKDGFWNRFQPNRWYPSIHYVTNTGRR